MQYWNSSLFGSHMSKSLFALIALFVVGCGSGVPTESKVLRSLPPPTLSMAATTQRVLNSSGGRDLEVTALLRNPTKVHIRVVNGPQCSLVVRLSPDPTGEMAGSLDGSMGCPSGLQTIDLAPGDSVVLKRVLASDTLSSFPAGTYGVNVAITTATYVQGAWAGAVVLPL